MKSKLTKLNIATISTLLTFPVAVLAQQQPYKFLEVGLFGTGSEINLANPNDFETFIRSAYTLFLTICIITAVIMIVIHGLEYMLTNIPSSKVTSKNRMRSAILGLIIALTAWLFLNTLNPKLVNLNLNLGQIVTNNSDTVVGTGGGGGGQGDSPGDVSTTPTGPVIDVCNNDTKIPSAYTVANEGFRNKPYVDSRGFLTVGVGHKLSGPNDPLNRELSDQEIKDLYAQDYSKHANEARASASRHGVNFDSLSPNRQAVLVDMAFNMGAAQGGGLDDFKLMWEGIKNNNYNQASAEILSSEYAGQVPGRARGNADIMKTDSSDPMHRQIQSDPQAASFCV